MSEAAVSSETVPALAGEGPVAVVGLSVGHSPCGVRDHAQLLAAHLERGGTPCSLHWLRRREEELAGSSREISSWARELEAAVERERPRAVLVHYSVFAYGHRGVPVFVPRVMAAIARASAPVIGMLHELVYPWNLHGPRAPVWASTQRLALIRVMRTVDAAILTAQQRIDWVHSRPYLPRRPLTLAPVYSNLPAPRVVAPRSAPEPSVGVFGYSYESAGVDLVLDALRKLGSRGVHPTLRLLGAPGPDSRSAERWRARASERGLLDRLFFSGRLPAQELSDALAECDVLMFSDVVGPDSRKGTLAGALASGRPLVAIDGPQTWSLLRAEGAVRLAAGSAGALADAVEGLLASPAERDALGARGRAFAARHMSIERTAGAFAESLRAAQATARGVSRQTAAAAS